LDILSLLAALMADLYSTLMNSVYQDTGAISCSSTRKWLQV